MNSGKVGRTYKELNVLDLESENDSPNETQDESFVSINNVLSSDVLKLNLELKGNKQALRK